MKIEIAQRSQVKIKMAVQGPAGSGKTIGALQLAYGLCGNWGKIVVIDTENYSASLYAHLGKFSVLNLSAPYTPEKYVDAIQLCVDAGMEVIIIDSISHEWEGAGGILDIHSSMAGNSFTNWGKLTPRHNDFVQAILHCNAHIIATIRSKQEYVLNEKNGKQIPEKVGLKGVTRDGMDYEFTILFDLDIKHNANATKDRTGLFMDKPEVKLTKEVGQLILDWCIQGKATEFDDSFTDRINACETPQELNRLYILNPEFQQSHLNQFVKRKKELQTVLPTLPSHLNNHKTPQNGNT